MNEPTPDCLSEFVAAVLADPVCSALMDRVPALGIADWWLTGGAVFQNVWNNLSGKAPGAGIKDYDIFYFDAADLSWEAEDAVIQRVARATDSLAARIEVKNEARAHIWLREKWGRQSDPFTCAADAIDTFCAVCCTVGIHRNKEGAIEVYAPYGLQDVFGMVMRPSPGSLLQSVYELKADQYRQRWPELQVIPWQDRRIGG